MKRKINIIEITILLLSFIAIFLFIIITPVFNKYQNNGLLIINEVMSSNNYTIEDKYGNYSDYIELYNAEMAIIELI